MKAGWQIKRLGDVCTFDKVQDIHAGLPYVGLENIESHTAKFIGLAEAQSVKSSTFRFSEKHILYGRLRPYLNKVLAPDFEGHCSTEIFPIKPNDLLSREYLLYWFLADETVERINATCTGARMPRADMKDVLEFNFPLPPLPEQQRIVGILDKAFDGIAIAKAHAEQNLQNARALFESHLQSVFTQRGEGWVDKQLSDVCVFVNGRAYKKEELLDAGKYPVLRVGNFFTNNHWYHSDLELEPDKYCDTGDLLYAWSASFGPRVWEGGKVIYHYHIWKVLPNTELIEKRFLLHLLEWDVEQIKLAHGTGTTMMHVSKGAMESRVVPIPPLKDQGRIVSQLDELKEETQRLESLYQRKLAALDELKKSLLHQAFSGQL
jgi:type I restriction enzyme S subunit